MAQAAQKVQVNSPDVKSEIRRTLSLVQYDGTAGVKSVDVPRDSVFKRFQVRMNLSFIVTYASGSPISSPDGVMNKILPRIDIVANGQDTIKSVEPYFMRMQGFLLSTQMPERAYSTSASAFTTALAQTESLYGQPFAYPATTQYVLVNESIYIYMECPWAYGAGRESTMWNTKRLSTAEMRFTFSDATAVQRAESSAVSVAYTSVSGSFEIMTVEAQHVDANMQFNYFKETTRAIQFSSETRDFAIELNRGAFLTGLHFLVRNGDANKSLSDIAIKNLRLLLNGTRILQNVNSLAALQQENRQRYGVYAPKGTASAGITHSLQGYGFMNLLLNGELGTSLDTRLENGVSQLFLQATSAASSGTDAATYTNPVELRILTQEIVSSSVKV